MQKPVYFQLFIFPPIETSATSSRLSPDNSSGEQPKHKQRPLEQTYIGMKITSRVLLWVFGARDELFTDECY